MKFNNVGPTKEFDKRSHSHLYLLAIVVAAVLGFVLLFVLNLGTIILFYLIEKWVYVVIVLGILFLFKIKGALNKTKYENRSK